MSSQGSSPQPFTRANVFSTILAVQLCQLTQPSGSLIFPGRAGLFWRSNPIASFVEGCMIIRYIVSAFFPGSPGERLLSRTERVKNVGYVLLLYRRDDLPHLDKLWTTESEEKLLECMRSDSGTNRWLIISLITTIPEIATFVKLFGVSGVPFLRATITCMVFAWLCVQLLQLLIPPVHELRDRVPHIQRTADSLCTRLQAEQRLWKFCLTCLHLPLFGFLGYKATGALSQDLVNVLQWSNLFTTPYFLIGLIWFLIRNRYLPMPRTAAYLLAPGLLSYKETNRNTWVIGRAINFLLVFEVTLVIYILSISEASDDGMLQYAVNFVLFRRNLSDPIHPWLKRRMPSTANIVVAIGIFTVYVTTYKPEGTVKAGWTEWLG